MPSQRMSEKGVMELPGAPGTGGMHRGMHRTSAHEALVLMLSAVLVGLASGLSAVVLTKAVHAVITIMQEVQGVWWMVGVPGIGAALSALFLHRVLRDNAGHGVPELIRSAVRRSGRLRKSPLKPRIIGERVSSAASTAPCSDSRFQLSK